MSETERPGAEIWRHLVYAQRSLTSQFAGRLRREFGLTMSQFEALLALWEAPGHFLHVSQLARTLLYSSGSTTHLVDRLKSLGLVGRCSCTADARMSEIRLTERGEDVIRRATQAYVATMEEMFEAHIEPGEIDTLLRFARRLAAGQRSPEPATETT
ncbi:hypothetical protein GCM10009785_16030 [Brooklawnia cerclae]|uniref:DNA-binding MarR family transcriptional regulator n=1 Tax=Brooklawnia cerclae TaxID=349934 RepID=A0ABX0SHE8_9ACTN|nr:MarR family transcriptional regulator [Brooklawnia cerclae]NIH57828.1 DNA-binding MarR family transcriptional regulator [Brooklawnia cerclae]